MAKDKTPLTEKQQDVFTLLNDGLTPTEAAERLDTSATNIYGHMRKIKAKGYRLPRLTKGRKPARKPRATAQSNGQSNGHVRLDDMPTHIAKAVAAINEAIEVETEVATERKSDIETLRNDLERAETEAELSVRELSRLQSARTDLIPA